jgi:hypothetical protein
VGEPSAVRYRALASGSAPSFIAYLIPAPQGMFSHKQLILWSDRREGFILSSGINVRWGRGSDTLGNDPTTD